MRTVGRDITKSRWLMPAFSLALGAAILTAFWLGGDPRQGVWSFLALAGVGALFLFGSRSETLRGLGGPGRDERFALIDTRATAFAGTVVILFLIGLWLHEIAGGRDGAPYGNLMAVGGMAYVIGVVWQRARS